MNDRQKGYHRDRQIIEEVERCRCLNTEQIQALLFPIPSGKRKCQMGMKRITDKGRLKRWRYALEEPYAYYSELNNRVEQLEHTVLLNWVHVWIIKTLKPWEKLHSFSYEDDYGVLRTDAFAAVKNTFTGEFRFCFVEMDRTTSNRFDKVTLYNDLYESEDYSESWWVPLAKRYPPIIIATTNTRRKRRIEEAIKSDNRHGLEFRVYLVQALRQEVI